MMDLLMQVLINGLLIGGIYALISIGLTLLFGVVDIVNFAHGEFVMMGMYASYWTWVLSGMDPLLTLFISVPTMFLVGMIIQKYLFSHIMKAPPLTQIFLTVGLQLVLQNGALMVFGSTTRSINFIWREKIIKLGELVVPLNMLVGFVLSILLAALLFLFLSKTDLGKAMKAAKLDRETAMLMGINTNRIFLIAAGITAALTGAAGTAIGTFQYVQPLAGAHFGLMAYIVVILGGLGNLKGALIGGLILGVAESFGIQYISANSGLLAAFILFLIVLMIKPSGLFSSKGAT
ncbi:branched-chain amino acid ABC transporter permease [Paenibacillus alginolyticus]|uniref:branched-chain amino acid ABC transporter permease n=1 Tax=Paenibacillus alginolyticus TaxID=59839 RepID=UPI0004240682|nr:branched-chain amino acid ABC transporter permease [Paenibacillus alginolyticus]MCY9669222.1 branched-chain amino acid ABC transporter permease [Paenibacillus alginolyticus]